MLRIQIKDSEVTKLMNQVRRRGTDMRRLMKVFHGRIHVEVMRNFRKQGATADVFRKPPSNQRKAWKKITPYTAAARLGGRASTSRVGGILQASGMLMGTMGKVKKITKQSMTYGSSSGIAHVHQFGAVIRPKRAKVLALPYPGVKGRPADYRGVKTFVRGKTIYQATGKGLRPLFFFKDEVTIPARPMITFPKSTIDSFRDLTFKYLTGKTVL